MTLFDKGGNRKYLTTEERQLFLTAAKTSNREVRTFCLMLLYSGCRISEVLAIRVKDIDISAKAVIIHSLKKRKTNQYRHIPLSLPFLDELELAFNLKQLRKKQSTTLLWNWSRSTASRRVNEVMGKANIKGIHATPKGLRHSFAIYALQKNIPLNMVSKWMGHASLEVTAIYANAMGQEERNIAKRLWE